MKKPIPTLRPQLSKVRGHGSSHNGTHHYWMQRVTAMFMLPLIAFIFFTFIHAVVFGGYEEARLMMSRPLMGVFMIMFLGLANYHGTNGIQSVLEDYVSCHGKRTIFLLTARFVALTFTLIGMFAILKIMLQG